MSKQNLRGSKCVTLMSIASTLEVALKGAESEEELRRFVQVVINNIKSQVKPSNLPKEL